MLPADLAVLLQSTHNSPGIGQIVTPTKIFYAMLYGKYLRLVVELQMQFIQQKSHDGKRLFKHLFAVMVFAVN